MAVPAWCGVEHSPHHGDPAPAPSLGSSRPPVRSPAPRPGWSSCLFLLSLPLVGLCGKGHQLHSPLAAALTAPNLRPLRAPRPAPRRSQRNPRRRTRALRAAGARPRRGSEWITHTQCPASCPHPPSRPVSLAPPSPQPDPPAGSPSPRSRGSRDGGAVRQAQPPAPMAARRSQRRRGRRGEPGTALLAPLVLGLGLALACLGLLLAVVSLGSRASLSAQVRPRSTPLPGHMRSEDCRGADGSRVGRGPGNPMMGGGRDVRWRRTG